MEYIDINNLHIFDSCGSGSYSKVFKCEYDGKIYAFKRFEEGSNILNKAHQKKFIRLRTLELKKSLLPYHFVCENRYVVGYLLEPADNGDISFLTEQYKKIQALKSVKESILELHSRKVIHTDIHSGNIMTIDGKYFLIDFDNSRYRTFHSSRKDLSDFAYTFVKKRGMSKDLDIFLFNLLTFSELTGIDYNLSRFNIICGNYGIFKSSESRSICDSLLLRNRTFNNDFLIDTIEDEKAFCKQYK